MRVSQLFATISMAVASLISAAPPSTHPVSGGRAVHGPVVHENLGVFIITGAETLGTDADYVTLAEAMENEWVVVHETGRVNQLTVENVTADRTILILSGSVVKGGKQDRVLSLDMVLKPKSGKVPIASFCVEQSRWSKRGNEKLDRFASNSAQVSGQGLRKAVKGGLGQQMVWSEVAKEQKKISSNVMSDVQENASPTSFQLAIENKDLQKQIAQYKTALVEVIEKHPDAIGYAVTINGQFSTADVYASRGLFRKMWDQHLNSAVTEAISLKDKQSPNTKIDLEWRDEIFAEKSFENKIDVKTAGLNSYAADQNKKFFRYNCVIPENGKVVLRMSFENRESGESLDKPVATDNRQQIQSRFNSLPNQEADDSQQHQEADDSQQQ